MRLIIVAAPLVAGLLTSPVRADEGPSTAGVARQYDVHVVQDVSYLEEDRAEKLDLYLPQSDADGPWPAVVIIHGGGWFGGDKAAAREQNIGLALSAAGFVCASINYRLAEKTDHLATRLHEVWPQNLQDCQTAVRFLRARAAEYHIAPESIGAIGGSAGGHLVAMLAVTDATGEADPHRLYADQSARIQAVVPMYGVHDVIAQARSRGNELTPADEEICREASPITYITPDDPPAMILHGTADATVPTEQSRLLHQHLLKAQVASELLIIDGAPHSFHLQPKQQDLRAKVIRFFDRHLRGSESGHP